MSIVAIAAAATTVVGCQYNPADVVGQPLMKTCEGEQATIGIGYNADQDPPAGSVYQGTEGRDIVVVLNGPVTFNGLGGDDLVCLPDLAIAPVAGAVATIDLGEGDDRLVNGSALALDLDAGPGNDDVTGGSGADHLVGGEGDDSLRGGAGTDTIDGDLGRDTIAGDDGDDILGGGADADVITAGPGVDVVTGGDGDDQVDGGAGNDDLSGGAGADRLTGGDGDDELAGDVGDDRLDGGAGDDVLSGAAGDDTLVGGPDDDSCDGGSGDEHDGDVGHSCETATAVEQLNIQIISPSNDETVFGSAAVVVDYEVIPGVTTIELRVDGDLEATVPVGGTSAVLDLADRTAGPVTIDVEAKDAQGAVLAFASVDVTLELPDVPDLNQELATRRAAGTITADEYLVSGFLAASMTPVGTGETDGLPFAQLLSAWNGASNDARQAVLDQHRVVESPGAVVQPVRAVGVALPVGGETGGGADAGAGDPQADCPEVGPLTWAAGLFYERTFCGYALGPESFANPSEVPGPADQLTDVTWYVEPSLDRTDRNGDGVPDVLVSATIRVWEAQLLFQERGLELPEVHRGEVPLNLFVMDNDRPAYSSPFDEREAEIAGIGIPWFGTHYGHPIRLSGQVKSNGLSDLDRTIVHELFHTFEWNTIDWADDVAATGNTGATVALYESGANWGAQEYSATQSPHWGYNASLAANEWLDEPSKAYLSYPNGLATAISTQGSAYSYFPALEWLDEHGGGAGQVGSSGLIRDVFRSYGDRLHGADPIDLIEDEVDQGQWAAPSGQPRLSRAWPRMWAAMYLLDDDHSGGGSPFDNDEFRWAKFWGSETDAWQQQLKLNPDTAGDGAPWEWARPARLGGPVALTEAAPAYVGDDFVLHGGGAAFQDVDLPDHKEGIVRLGVDALDGDDQFEAFAVVWADGGDGSAVCVGRDGRPVIAVSDGARLPDGSVALDVPYRDDCSRATVGAVHVVPNSIVSDSFRMLATLVSVQDPSEIPVNITAPTIAKSSFNGRPTMYRADPGTWTSPPGSFTQHWLTCDASGDGCTPIADEWSTCYPSRFGQIGSTIRLELRPVGPGGQGAPVRSNALEVVEDDFDLLADPDEPLLFDDTTPPDMPGQQTLVSRNDDGTPDENYTFTAFLSGNGRVAHGGGQRQSGAWATEQQRRLTWWNMGSTGFSATGRYAVTQMPVSYNPIAVLDLACGGYQELSVDPGTGGSGPDWHYGAYPRLSSDGRFATFSVLDKGFLAGETYDDYRSNVFRYDRETGSLDLVSDAATGDSALSDISDNGQYVAFWTDSADLGADPATGGGEIVVKDMDSGALTVASSGIAGRMERTDIEGGPANEGSSWRGVRISNDGAFVSFMARGEFLDGGSWNGQPTARPEQRLYRASRSGGGVVVNEHPEALNVVGGYLSGDGSSFVLASFARLGAGDDDDDCDFYVTDVGSGSYTNVSPGNDSTSGGCSTMEADISDDGRFVALSQIADLRPPDENGNFYQDLWIFDRGA